MNANALRQFFFGLEEIKNKIDFALEKDRVSGFPGTRACGFPEFMELLGNTNIPEDKHIRIEFIPDVEKEGADCLREIEKAEKEFRKKEEVFG